MKKKKIKKQLRKKLKNRFINPYFREYHCIGAIKSWLSQCGIEVTDKHVEVLLKLHGCMLYPYSKADRKAVIKALKEEK